MSHLFSSILCRMVAVSSLLSLGSCASTPELDLLLAESSRGTVYLERIPDRSFQAAHPIMIDQGTLARVLSGISIKEHQGLLQDLLAGQSPVIPAFTEDEIHYLAPLLAEGLARAASDQQVGFRLTHSASPGLPPAVPGPGMSGETARLALIETSQGSVYAYGRSLYVTLLEYRVRSGRTDTINKGTRHQPDHSGLMNQTVLFTPESAKRPDSYRGKNATGTTLVIDYEGLATLSTILPVQSIRTLPAQTPTPHTSPDAGTSTQLRRIQEQMSQKNRELEEMRKELEDIRRQMHEPATVSPTPAH